jgi:hypothetical protein
MTLSAYRKMHDHQDPNPITPPGVLRAEAWYSAGMNHDKTPVLEAIDQYRRSGDYTFSLPGHRFGRGIDSPRMSRVPSVVTARAT